MFDGEAEPPETLPFLVSIDDVDDADGQVGANGEKGIFSRRDDEPRVREIPVAVLQENLQHAVGRLRALFDEVAAAEGGMPLKQAQISFEVTASGGIALVGTSAQVAGKGGITLTFGE